MPFCLKLCHFPLVDVGVEKGNLISPLSYDLLGKPPEFVDALLGFPSVSEVQNLPAMQEIQEMWV